MTFFGILCLQRIWTSICFLLVGGVGWVASYPLSSQARTHVEVELGSDNIKPSLFLPDSIICPGWPMFGSKSVKYKNELRSNRTSLKLQIFRSMMAFLPRYLNYLFSILYVYIENVHLIWYLWTVFLNTCYHFSAHWAFGGEFPVLPCTVIATDLQNTRYKYENKH